MKITMKNVTLTMSNKKREYVLYSDFGNKSLILYPDDNKLYVATYSEFLEVYAYPIKKGNTYRVTGTNKTTTAGNTATYPVVMLGISYESSIGDIVRDTVFTNLIHKKVSIGNQAWPSYEEIIYAENDGWIITSSVLGTYETVVKTYGNDGVYSLLSLENPLFNDSYIDANGQKQTYNGFVIKKFTLEKDETLVLEGIFGTSQMALIAKANSGDTFPVEIIKRAGEATTVEGNIKRLYYTATENGDVLVSMSTAPNFYLCYIQ